MTSRPRVPIGGARPFASTTAHRPRASATSTSIPPSPEIEEQIGRWLAVGVGANPQESLSELAKLGARLITQRAVEDEFDGWLGRARRHPARGPGR